MKKIIFAVLFAIMIGFSATAQTDNYVFDEDFNRDATTLPEVPWGAVGWIIVSNQTTPLGSGLLVLTGLGAGYAFLRKKSKK